MKPPILHPRTKSILGGYLANPTHGLLLSGSDGTGKYYLAQWLASELSLNTITVEVLEDKSNISIDQIRALYRLTRTGNGLMVVIKDAHQLSVDAQNAFLKLLEEPPKNTRFILTSKNLESLLPTIRSRCQIVEIIKPLAKDLISEAGAEPSIISLLHTTDGLPGDFFSELSSADSLEEHQKLVDLAKQFYAASTYQRHLILIEHKYDMSKLTKLLDLLAIIIQSLLKKNADQAAARKKLIKQAELVEQTTLNLTRINGNPKIHLTKLATQL